MRRRRFFTLLTLSALLTTLFVTSSLALFTSSDTIADNSLDTGTLTLEASPATLAIGYSNMFPGDVTVAPVTVANTGSGDLRYSMSITVPEVTAGEPDLAREVQLLIKSGVATCDAAAMGDPTQGSTLYDGPLAGGAFGDSSPGQHVGDRSLATGSSEAICLRATLPSSADNAFQGLSTVATFVFDAEQTRNN